MTRRSRSGLAPAVLAAALAAVTAGSINAESASINATVQVLAINVELTLSSGDARVGDRLRATATVINAGATRLSGIAVELRIDAAGLRVQGSTASTIARLQPGRSASAVWTVCAVQPGNYVLLARGTVNGVSIDSPARLLTVAGERRRGCT